MATIVMVQTSFGDDTNTINQMENAIYDQMAS